MSRSARVAFDWGDGHHEFRLAIDQLDELDQLCGVGPGYALGLISAGTHGNWKAKWIREVIRLGLIGGGAAPVAALQLVRTYVDARPLEENIFAAHAILAASVVGVEDDAPGEPEGAAATAPNSQTVASASPSSTATAPRSDSRRKTSAAAPSGSSPPPSPAGGRRTARTTKTS